jgi:hypothetical protein
MLTNFFAPQPAPAPDTSEEPLPVVTGASAVGTDIPEMTDLNQRLAILQNKRVEDKARIKELEKYKAHYMQVLCWAVTWDDF